MLPERLTIYTQGSDTVGAGHVMRCLALEEYATKRGIDTCLIAVDDETAAMLSTLRPESEIYRNRAPARWVIRDLPGDNDPDQVRTEEGSGQRVLLLDEKGNSRCVASIVVDAMMTPDRAAALPASNTTAYHYGLEYTPLRQSIQNYIGKALPNQGRRVVLALGHGFVAEYLGEYLESLARRGFEGVLDILLPNPLPASVLIPDTLTARCHLHCQDIGPLLSQADLIITKLGMTQLEAFAIGVSCLVVEPGSAHLEVQHSLAAHYGDWPAQECGLVSRVPPDWLATETLRLLARGDELLRRGLRAAELVDGRGCDRILDLLFEGEG